MLRRAPVQVKVAALSSRMLSGTSPLRLEFTAEERGREAELRQKVLQRYRGMQMPEITNHVYGHFSTMGLNTAAAQQATGDATASILKGGIPYGGTGGIPGSRGIDWLMLLTGTALVYLTGKIMYNQMTRGVDGLDMPLWVASVDIQAKHLLFAVQFEVEEQERLKQDFLMIRKANPFADFFHFVKSQRPEFCVGRKYSMETVMQTLAGSLQSTNGTQLAAVARTLQRAMTKRGGDPMQRVDDFMDQMQGAGYLLQSFGGVMGRPQPSWGSGYVQTQPPPPSALSSPNNEAFNINSALDVKENVPHESMPFAENKS